ncbi:proline-rich family protein [Striga hermonthica]|uniref:Proline-rich family protein n=1 Tax=Striga hermonthica TaxID=68872 RepID=A0A9N7P4G8_STRHE|nr:proline-rich family protein [Striga hermonthica]
MFWREGFTDRLPSNPNPNYPQLAPRPPHSHDPPHLLYPLASSSRGFVSRPAGGTSPRPPFVYPYFDPGRGNPGFVRPNQLPQVLLGSGPGSSVNPSGTGVMPGVVKGVPVSSSHHPKAGPPSDINGHNNLRDRNRDDTLAVVRDRKVRITENASLYGLCRSWLRNGFPEETQLPPYLDMVKSLPRPLPVAAQTVESPDKEAENKEVEDEEECSVENLSEKELLQRHIKRAKRVRSRLREERLQRITRYKTRLALLLPPMVEQQYKNESDHAN